MAHLVENDRDSLPQEMEAPISFGTLGPQPGGGSSPKAVDDILYSDIGINVLLSRLKQSIASARDFAAFLKKRAALEEEHAQGLKKLSRTTLDNIRRPEHRQQSYAMHVSDVTRAHERMAEHGIQFSMSLQKMHEDLNELSNNMERGRKHWKQEGLHNEKKVKDAELLLEKAKSRYDSLAEDYDRARTGDKRGGVFGIKGPKSAEQREEDLHRKVQAADVDYQQKVQSAASSRQENIVSSRPHAIKTIQELVNECDSGLTLQLQKFAAFAEKLIVANGLVVTPMKDSPTSSSSGLQSIRTAVSNIDNERDFQSYVTSHSSQLPATPSHIKYEKHPALVTANNTHNNMSVNTNMNSNPIPQRQATGSSFSSNMVVAPAGPNPLAARGASYAYDQDASRTASRNVSATTNQPYSPSGPNGSYGSAPSSMASRHGHNVNGTNGLPNQRDGVLPVAPVFGVTLENLFRRDESAVPMVVYQCIQAIDLFGLKVEGIYRLSGNVSHMAQLKNLFNHNAARVDFRNPENFQHDVNSVAGLLKTFFRDLPDPLLTRAHYAELIEAARIDDDVMRRDSLHAVINALPDPNYATLRALVLHLHRVSEHSHINRMSTSNLAICFAPTIMGQHSGPVVADAGLQARAVDTILQNTYQIFDED